MTNRNFPATWADALARRAGTYGLGAWLTELTQWIDDTNWANTLSDLTDEAKFAVVSPTKGIAFTLKPMRGYRAALPEARSSLLVLDDVVFDAERIAELYEQSALPFGLAIQGETAQTAAMKIGTSDTTPGTGAAGERISYFLDDARVVEITFAAEKRIQRILITRLWLPVQYTE